MKPHSSWLQLAIQYMVQYMCKWMNCVIGQLIRKQAFYTHKINIDIHIKSAGDDIQYCETALPELSPRDVCRCTSFLSHFDQLIKLPPESPKTPNDCLVCFASKCLLRERFTATLNMLFFITL